MTTATSRLLKEYVARMPMSARLAERGARGLPQRHHARRPLSGEPYSIYVDRAAGSRKWDVDGHEFVDYSGGHGACCWAIAIRRSWRLLKSN